MTSLALRLSKLRSVVSYTTPSSSLLLGAQRNSKCWLSTTIFDSDNGEEKNEQIEEEFDDFLGKRPALKMQGLDPSKGWASRGVHKAIICGKVGQAPVQKILRSGKTVTIFTVGTGGMFDQRVPAGKDLPKPAQWHRIAVHNEFLGGYAVQKLAKSSSVYVEGDIETRVYNDSISGEVKNIPEICVRHDGTVRLIRSGENVSSAAFDDLREGLFNN